MSVIDITEHFLSIVEFAFRGYVSTSSKVYYNGYNDITNNIIPVLPHEYYKKIYISSAGKVYYKGYFVLDFFNYVDIDNSSKGYVKNIKNVVIFHDTNVITISMLPRRPNEETEIIVLGYGIDFYATPRVGRAPLKVYFHNESYGVIEEYLWLFGDNTYSKESVPTHIYRRHGVYDVTLRIRVNGRWYSQTRHKYIIVYPGGLIMANTNRSFTLAILPSQGVGFSENTGGWPMPETGMGPIFYHDDNNQPHLVVQDSIDGYEYDILQRDGPENSNITKKWKDRVAVNGTGGIDVPVSVKFPADVGTFEYFWLRHGVSHIFARSANELKYRGAEGYDSTGFPIGLNFVVKYYVDGERVTAERQVKNIPITGDITTDEHVEGHRIQLELTANMGAHAIVGRLSKYITTDKIDGSAVMAEDGYQEELSVPVQWFSRGKGGLFSFVNRATGVMLDSDEINKLTRCEGPDGEPESAVQFTEAVIFPSVNITNGSVLLWHQGLDNIKIGDDEIVLVNYNTMGSWTLSYAINITASGEVTITPSETGKIFDCRIFNNIITIECIEYYYNNIVDKNGDVVLTWE